MSQPNVMEPTPPPPDLKARLQTSYNAIAETYQTFTRIHDPIRFDFIARLLQLLREKEGEAGRPPSVPAAAIEMLELGIGAGVPGTQMLLQHRDPSIRVTGNDLSPVQLELAARNLAPHVEDGTLRLVGGDMLSLDLPEASFDAVVAFYSIIHLPRDEQRMLMKKVARWLKPGALFLGCFGEDSTEGVVMRQWLDQERGWMFWSGWGIEGSVRMVKSVGLEVLVQEVREDIGASFLWVIARRPLS
ncbi:S-adenosyl-L-methionine-dependent methyltransferase [Corynespora cassiicola Philippines]|uniref:S-adenosyl-L-methionine-dependent methyltransferase n=1 Tax=Corynespora cassiicola Philippines TaxID=1448308 RepID=A0A2T2P6X0_CORCC|nr:S-adenosyl-L-methionine-dependent methyltransferase [Corynespora cassiicola Philippines]